jgi:histidinol dehydrogenase
MPAFQARPLYLSTADASFEAQFAARLHWSSDTDTAIEQRVADILSAVKKDGDAAVLAFTQQFDGLNATSVADLELTQAELKAAFEGLPPIQRTALEQAAKRIRSYHQAQKHASGESWHYRDEDGTLLGQKVTPLDRVGIYVPGGKAAYPSSVLMNAIPAHVAGVEDIIMVVPTPRGEKNALVLAAAYVAGVSRAFTLGGAQAVGALAYGTATVPKVDKITGPGNAYVASAKKRVFGTVGIDMIAGPSEILVLADGSTPAEWVAMDLFSQAEHDELAQSILLCPDAAYIAEVQAAIDRLLNDMPRAAIIAKSLNDRGALILTRSMEEACAISNRIAPEHLEVSSAEPHRWEPLLKHAGALFLGAFTSESLGDYCAGPNHVLPTSGTARFSSPLGVMDFQKRSSLIEVSEQGAQVLGQIASVLGHGEGLQAHARAAEMRLRKSKSLDMAVSSVADGLDVVRPEIRALHAYVVQDAAGFVKLDAMENPFSLPLELQQKLGERLAPVALNRYPGPRVNDLKKALLQSVQEDAPLPAGYDLVLGNGSDELIAMLSMACARPGAAALAPEPGFVMYGMSSKLAGLRYVGVPLTADFELDADAMLTAIEAHRPALVYLAYPNNPSANLWSADVIRRVIQATAAIGGWVVMDEAYQPFASLTWLTEIKAHPSANDRVLLMRTLSKFGLAGVRLGYLIGPAALVCEIDKVRPPYNVSVLNTEAALFALEHAPVFAQQAKTLRHERAALVAALQALPGVKVWPSQANMVLVRVSHATKIFEAMKAQGVLIKNVSKMHPLLDQCLRLTVGTPEENRAQIAALKTALNGESSLA